MFYPGQKGQHWPLFKLVMSDELEKRHVGHNGGRSPPSLQQQQEEMLPVEDTRAWLLSAVHFPCTGPESPAV